MYRKTASNPTTGQENPFPYTPIEDADISKSTNRFTADTTYDDAGNVIVDDKFRSMSFAYDANGRMVKTTKPSVPDALSAYDAAGLRVAEKVNDVWRFMVFDIGGKLVAEYGGLQSTDEGGVKYILQDWQGSTRAVVGNTGTVQSRSDYTAFGESIGSGTGLRSSGFGKSDSLRQGYALTENDDATGLDQTWFRKHENQAGRWTSPDPYTGSMSIGDPQSFNRYSYVQNDPVNWIDPSGLTMASPNWLNRAWQLWSSGCSELGGEYGSITICWTQNPWNTPDPSGGDDVFIMRGTWSPEARKKYEECAKPVTDEYKKAVDQLNADAEGEWERNSSAYAAASLGAPVLNDVLAAGMGDTKVKARWGMNPPGGTRGGFGINRATFWTGFIIGSGLYLQVQWAANDRSAREFGNATQKYLDAITGCRKANPYDQWRMPTPLEHHLDRINRPQFFGSN